MAWKKGGTRDVDNIVGGYQYRCRDCGYECETYEVRGLFRQEIHAVTCPDCKTIQNLVVGGIIADVTTSFRRGRPSLPPLWQ